MQSTIRDLRESRARVVAVGHAERRRIERDLHDGVQQQLTAVRMKLELAREAAPGGTPERERLDDLCADVEGALAALRELAHRIFPAALTDHGLLAALRSTAASSPPGVRIDGNLSNRRFPPELEAAVYFCCLEALQEAHPGSAVTIDVADSGDELEVAIRLEGGGIDPAGLTRMQDRLAALGGVASESRSASGTVVNCSLPSVAPSRG